MLLTKTMGSGASVEKYLERWREKAGQLKIETYPLYLAYRDPRLPWLARIFAAGVVGYAFSPLDLIPDFIPILGYLDDLVLIPLGVKIALSMIPGNIIEENRKRAQEVIAQGKPVNWIAGVIIGMIWLIVLILMIVLLGRFIQDRI